MRGPTLTLLFFLAAWAAAAENASSSANSTSSINATPSNQLGGKGGSAADMWGGADAPKGSNLGKRFIEMLKMKSVLYKSTCEFGAQRNMAQGLNYAGCMASSEKDGHECINAFRPSDDVEIGWQTKGEGAGAFVQVDFGSPVEINMFKWQHRAGPPSGLDQRLRITFSDGRREVIMLNGTPKLQAFPIRRVVTTMARIYIQSVAGAESNGAHSIQFIGCPKNKKEMRPVGMPQFVQRATNAKDKLEVDTSMGFRLAGAPHTVMMTMRLPPLNEDKGKRQWIMNIGQDGPGAHHWLWSPESKGIQFGVWGGAGYEAYQITDGNFLTAQGSALQVITTTWDGKVYTLYVNGRKAEAKTLNIGSGTGDYSGFNIQSGHVTVAAGHIGEDAFKGAVTEVKAWRQVLSPDEVMQESLSSLPSAKSNWVMRTGFQCTLKKPQDAIPSMIAAGAPRKGEHLTAARCEMLCRERVDCLSFEHTEKSPESECWLFAISVDKMSDLPPQEEGMKQACGQAACSSTGQRLCLPESSTKPIVEAPAPPARCYDRMEHTATVQGKWVGKLMGYEKVGDCQTKCDIVEGCMSFTACPGDANTCYLKSKTIKPDEDQRDVGRGCATYYVSDKESCKKKTGKEIEANAPKMQPFWAPEGAECPKEEGFCVTDKDADQNEQVTKYDEGEQDPLPDQEDEACLGWCRTQPGATGCERIEKQGNAGCYVHRSDVDHGNKADNHVCWVFSKCDPPPPTAEQQEIKYMGCYNESGVDRDLPIRKGNGDMEQCSKECAGFLFFGLTWTKECWCGATFGRYGETEGCQCEADNIGLFKNCVYKNTAALANKIVPGQAIVVQLSSMPASATDPGSPMSAGNGGKGGKGKFGGKKWWGNFQPSFSVNTQSHVLADKLGSACGIEAFQLCGAKPGVQMPPKRLMRCLHFHHEQLSTMCAAAVDWAIKEKIGEASNDQPGEMPAKEPMMLDITAKKPLWKMWQFWVGVSTAGTILGACAALAFTLVFRFTNERHSVSFREGQPDAEAGGAGAVFAMATQFVEADNTVSNEEILAGMKTPNKDADPNADSSPL